MSRLYLCQICETDPMWRLQRHGDLATTWACPTHLSEVADYLQRDFEVTEVTLILSAKASEWASIAAALEAVAEEGPA